MNALRAGNKIVLFPVEAVVSIKHAVDTIKEVTEALNEVMSNITKTLWNQKMVEIKPKSLRVIAYSNR